MTKTILADFWEKHPEIWPCFANKGSFCCWMGAHQEVPLDADKIIKRRGRATCDTP